MVKNKVNQGRCRWILYGYLNYLAKDGEYRNGMLFSIKIFSPCIRPANRLKSKKHWLDCIEKVEVDVVILQYFAYTGTFGQILLFYMKNTAPIRAK